MSATHDLEAAKTALLEMETAFFTAKGLADALLIMAESMEEQSGAVHAIGTSLNLYLGKVTDAHDVAWVCVCGKEDADAAGRGVRS